MGKPEPIQAILPSVLGKLQGEPQRDVEKLWKRFVGAHAVKTKIASCREGKWVILVGNASLLQELSFKKEELLRRFEKALGKGVVQEIQLRIGEIR